MPYNYHNKRVMYGGGSAVPGDWNFLQQRAGFGGLPPQYMLNQQSENPCYQNHEMGRKWIYERMRQYYSSNTKLEEWVAYEDQKRLEERNALSDDQYFAPDHTTQTWALLGTPMIEPSNY